MLPPEWQSEPRKADELSGWRGSPLEERNRGAKLEAGTLFCLVGDPRRVEAVAIVDQSDVERIAVGARAELKFDQAAGEILSGTVTEVAELDVDVAPRQLAYGGELPVRKDNSGVARPLTASYQVRVELDPHDCKLLLGTPGRVKILGRRGISARSGTPLAAWNVSLCGVKE